CRGVPLLRSRERAHIPPGHVLSLSIPFLRVSSIPFIIIPRPSRHSLAARPFPRFPPFLSRSPCTSPIRVARALLPSSPRPTHPPRAAFHPSSFTCSSCPRHARSHPPLSRSRTSFSASCPLCFHLIYPSNSYRRFLYLWSSHPSPPSRGRGRILSSLASFSRLHITAVLPCFPSRLSHHGNGPPTYLNTSPLHASRLRRRLSYILLLDKLQCNM
ncbi:hypothetical protein DFH09DRAFT_1438423, partial [Mycena vulgaris]